MDFHHSLNGIGVGVLDEIERYIFEVMMTLRFSADRSEMSLNLTVAALCFLETTLWS